MIFLERTRLDHRQSDEHWNRFKGSTGETSYRRGGGHNRPHRYNFEVNRDLTNCPLFRVSDRRSIKRHVTGETVMTTLVWISLACFVSISP